MSISTDLSTENLHADIVIIGGGGAGLTAAVSAIEAGAKDVMVLEKTIAPGGNTNISGGIFAAESPAQKRLGINVSADQLFKDKMEEAEWKIDPKLIRDFISKSGYILQWLEDKGLKSTHIIAMGVSHTPEREAPRVFHLFKPPQSDFPSSFMGPRIVETLVKECNNKGVRLLCETSAKKILTNEKGEVGGVVVETGNKELQINAKSVIIAAGGLGGSPEMVEKYFPSHKKIFSNSLPQMTGDGIIMAEEIGAMKENNMGIALIGPHHYPWATSLNLLLRRPHVILVNKKGERYFNESAQVGRNNALNLQPDKICYALLDSVLLRDIIGKRDILSSAENEQGDGGSWLETLESDFQKDAAKGYAKISDSWDKVAQWIGCDPNALKATVTQYNSFCENSYDADFLKDEEYLIPLRTPPFYAILGRQGFDTTTGGIKVNKRLEVIDKNANPISGLYAAGDNAAGCLSIAYKYPGSAMAFAIYSGYMAGENAAKYVSER